MTEKKQKAAIIDVGGGMRGMYSAGILDRLLDDKVEIPICIGVSAGSGNLASYCAGQKGRNYAFYEEYSSRRQYMSATNYLTKNTYFDFDYIYGDLTNTGGDNPLDYEAMKKSGRKLYVIATNTLTGKPACFSEDWIKPDHYDIFKASCAIPVLCHPYRVAGLEFCDGTVSNPVPVQKAFELGAEKVVLILSKPLELEAGDKNNRLMDLALKNIRYGRRYPQVVRALKERRRVYNESVRLAHKLEQEGKLLMVYPDELYGVRALSREKSGLHSLYLKGYEDGARIKQFIDSDNL